jgi:5-oxopent-3-ene-1,2,5-tricarboxylate decarboxylase / 2-hydroxyhepta-2,4-diene-1,7-dioate isomerase
MEDVLTIPREARQALSASCSDELLARLKNVSVGTLVQNLQRLGLHQTFMQGVEPRNKHRRFAGRAMTLRCLPPREDLVRELAKTGETLHRTCFEAIDPGQVLVIDARGDLSGAVLGDVLASRLAARGAAALVTDGAIRDLPAMQEVDLPIYSRGDHPRTFGEVHIAFDLNIPIQCAGVLVMPGDILVGDEEGVIVVPPAVAEKLADMGEEQERLDAFILTKVRQGAPLKGTFPPNEQVRAEYEAWKRQSETPVHGG